MAFTSLAAGVSGLQAFSEGVGVIADNITNVNTTGYKESRSTFSTLVTETSSTTSYSPGGVRSSTKSLISKQGLLQPSGSATDLAMDGAGFFVTKLATNGEADGELVYTRAGNFTEDADGFLRNTAGLYLMAWELDVAGNAPPNQNDITALVPVNFKQMTGQTGSTQNFELRANFSAEAPLTAYDRTTNGFQEGTYVPTTDDFIEDFTIVDGQGGSHIIKMAATKTGTNTWEYEVFTNKADVLSNTDIDGHDGSTNGQTIGYGTFTFGGDGILDLTNSTFFDGQGNQDYGAAGTNPFSSSMDMSFAFDVTGAVVAGDSPVGSDPIVVKFDFGDGTDSNGLLQKGDETALISQAVDGAQFGDVIGVSIQNDGDVTTLFDNGLTLTKFRLPVATFNNADGLIRRQGNSYGRSDVSGNPVMKIAGSQGAGKISSNTLELSTVDLASEFAELIKTQRAFSASTRIITTSDEILEELVRL